MCGLRRSCSWPGQNGPSAAAENLVYACGGLLPADFISLAGRFTAARLCPSSHPCLLPPPLLLLLLPL
jgi:hypothetical protein